MCNYFIKVYITKIFCIIYTPDYTKDSYVTNLYEIIVYSLFVIKD